MELAHHETKSTVNEDLMIRDLFVRDAFDKKADSNFQSVSKSYYMHIQGLCTDSYANAR